MRILSWSIISLETTPTTFCGVGHVDLSEGVLQMDLFVPPSEATIINTESKKAKNYFHKTWKANQG